MNIFKSSTWVWVTVRHSLRTWNQVCSLKVKIVSFPQRAEVTVQHLLKLSTCESETSKDTEYEYCKV